MEHKLLGVGGKFLYSLNPVLVFDSLMLLPIHTDKNLPSWAYSPSVDKDKPCLMSKNDLWPFILWRFTFMWDYHLIYTKFHKGQWES